jgi:hypothetical protein
MACGGLHRVKRQSCFSAMTSPPNGKQKAAIDPKYYRERTPVAHNQPNLFQPPDPGKKSSSQDFSDLWYPA